MGLSQELSRRAGGSCSCPNGHPLPPSPCSQFMSSTSFLASQPCVDASYGPSTTTPSFLPKTGDFPQVGTWSRGPPAVPLRVHGRPRPSSSVRALYSGRAAAPVPEGSQVAPMASLRRESPAGGAPRSAGCRRPRRGCGAASGALGPLFQARHLPLPPRTCPARVPRRLVPRSPGRSDAPLGAKTRLGVWRV